MVPELPFAHFHQLPSTSQRLGSGGLTTVQALVVPNDGGGGDGASLYLNNIGFGGGGGGPFTFGVY